MILQSHPSDASAWTLFAAPRCVLALPSADAARLGGVVDRLAGPDAFRAALELLVAGGIAGAPSFALLDGDSTVARVVLRGEASVTVTPSDPDAPEVTISGVGMATWAERVLEGAGILGLQVPGSVWTVTLAATAVGVAADVAASASAALDAPEPVRDDREPAVGEVTLVPRADMEAISVVEPPPSAPETRPVIAAVTAPEPIAEPYDFLFGDTIYRTQAGSSVRIPNPDPRRPGDHDGSTLLAEDLGLRGHVPAEPGFPALPSTPDDPHDAASDATVVAPIPGHVRAGAVPIPVTAPAPELHLERADGSRESLAQPVLIGRAPHAGTAAASGPAPRLITITDDKDISRSHLRVAVEGDAVVVTDLASRNGTVITLPGGSPRKLRGGEPTVVLPGTLIDLGGGVAFTVRED